MMMTTVEYPFDEYICGVTGLTCCGCSLFCEHRRERMINDKNALPVLTKEQIAELGKGLSEDFTESLGRAERLFKKPPIGLKPKFIHRKERINDILDAMERYTKAECLILPEWVDKLRELINDN